MYRIAGNIGGELYLADWRFSCHTANIKSANIAPTPREGVAIVPYLPILPFSSNPPNIIPANIHVSGAIRYTCTCMCVCVLQVAGCQGRLQCCVQGCAVWRKRNSEETAVS